MSLLGFFRGLGATGFGHDSTAADVTDGLDLSGRTVRGAYLADCNLAQPSRNGRDAGLAAKLWEKTEAIIAGLP